MTEALLFFAAVIVILTVGCAIGDGIGKLVEAHEIAKIPGAVPAQVARRDAAPRPPCPVEGPQVRASENGAGTGATVPGTGGVRRGALGEVGALSGHSLAVIQRYPSKSFDALWVWRCECGSKISGFDSEAEALASHAKHIEIEESIALTKFGGLT